MGGMEGHVSKGTLIPHHDHHQLAVCPPCNLHQLVRSCRALCLSRIGHPRRLRQRQEAPTNALRLLRTTAAADGSSLAGGLSEAARSTGAFCFQMLGFRVGEGRCFPRVGAFSLAELRLGLSKSYSFRVAVSRARAFSNQSAPATYRPLRGKAG